MADKRTYNDIKALGPEVSEKWCHQLVDEMTHTAVRELNEQALEKERSKLCCAALQAFIDGNQMMGISAYFAPSLPFPTGPKGDGGLRVAFSS